MSEKLVFNVRPTPKAIVANTRDRLGVPSNPASSNPGRGMSVRLQQPMHSVIPVKGSAGAPTSTTSKVRV